MNLLQTTFASVLDVLKKSKVEHIMVGGHVVNYYGYSRNTSDLDFMIVVSDVDMIVNAMKTAGFTSYSVEPLVIFFQKPESSIRVDFLRTDVTTLNKLMQSAVLANVMNCHVKIPSLIDLLAMKFFSYSQSPLRRVKDLNDIVWLSIENKLDPETVLRPIALKFANDETYRQVCAILSSNQI